MTPAKFPAWTRGKILSVTSITLVVFALPAGAFVLVPQAPLPTTPIAMTVVSGAMEPQVSTATITVPGIALGTWSFELQLSGAPDFHSLSKNAIGDLLLLVNYNV